MSGSNFAFVLCADPRQALSSTTRRLIKKHAMKEIGKSRRHAKYEKPSYDLSVAQSSNRKTVTPARVQSVRQFQSINECDEQCDSADVLAPIGSRSNEVQRERLPDWEAILSDPISRKWGGRIDYFKDYPIEMNTHFHGLIDHIYDTSVAKFKSCRDLWLPIVLADPAAFHQALALASLNLNFLRGARTVNVEAAAHHASAIKSVNERLMHPTLGMTDEMIGTIASFGCYYLMMENLSQWRVHIAGIRKIIELRGGLDSIRLNSSLRLVLLWIDICGASAQDLTPSFPIPLDLITQFNEDFNYSQYLNGNFRLWTTVFPDQPRAIEAFSDISALSIILNEQSSVRGFWESPMFVCQCLFPIAHKLLSLPHYDAASRATNATTSIMLESCRHAALLYIVLVEQKFGVYLIPTEIQLAKLIAVLNLKEKHDPNWRPFEVLRLWVVLLAWVCSYSASAKSNIPTTSPSPSTDEWVAQELKTLFRVLQLRSVEDVLMAFSNLQLPWNDNVFYMPLESFRELLDQC